ncbi:hypothetical protein CO683_00125 [Bradyrhizobium ottawaense]|uniref:Uncharacterized protein n=1 Tax=Bradyrhizobium ottawaense TaxID=931866 RepID=A0A2U8PGN0_9BRAD|nr:hypothetical protein CIT37_35915 [Bradyrhizobium ottawaense]PDT71611.1 hypothetical protein CO683_00125 [Bradyrhizobium ottawaense]
MRAAFGTLHLLIRDFGRCSSRFSGASDGSSPDAWAGAPTRPVKPSKLNDIEANAVLFAVWHECCLSICQKKRQLQNMQREGTFRCQPTHNPSPETTGTSPDRHCACLHECGPQ